MKKHDETPQERYEREQRRIQKRIRFCRAAILVVFLAAWEGAARTGLIDSFIFSCPTKVVQTLCAMWTGENLAGHIGITLLETLASFALVTAVSVGAAVLLFLFPRLFAVLEPYLVVLNSLPKSALAPLLIVWLGANVRTIIVAGMSVAVFGSIISLYSGFSAVDPDMLRLIATLGGGRKEMLTKVVLPFSLPCLLAALKVNIGLCLVGVVIGEFIGARRGLGYLIIYGSQVFPLAGKKITPNIPRVP